MAARFSKSRLAAIDGTKYLKIRAGTEHRFIHVWPVVIGDRVFVRSWNDKPTGWFRAFLAEPTGAIVLGEREVRVRAKLVTSAKVLDAMEAAYAAKYTTKANAKYVEGFREAFRRAASVELVPASAERLSSRPGSLGAAEARRRAPGASGGAKGRARR